VILCQCRPADRRLSTEPLLCSTCRGWVSRGRPLTPGQFGAAKRDCESLLANLGAEHPWVLSLCYDGAGHGEPGPRGSERPDPTGSLASSEQHGRIAAYTALSGRFLILAVKFLRQADEALGQACYEADRRPAERTEGEWYPIVAVPNEVEAARKAQARRLARGEGAP
jgi:hypothetical protein